MARNFHMTREDVKQLTKSLREKKLAYITIVATNREINRFVLLTEEEFNQSKAPLILRKPMYHILQDVGLWDKFRVSDLEDVYDYLPRAGWDRIDDVIYQEANTYLTRIKRLGYVPNVQEGRLIDEIILKVNEGVQDKHSKLSKLNKVSKQQLKMTDEEWHLYSTSGGLEFVSEDGIERDTLFNAFQTAGLLLEQNERVLEDAELVKGAKYFNTIFNRISRAKKTHVDILYEGLRGLVQQVGREKNQTALYYISQSLAQAVNRRLRFEEKVKEAMQFSDNYQSYSHIKTIKPIIHNNTPYILLTGDLDNIYYAVADGRNYVNNPVSRARGVTELEDVGTGVKTYRLTLNAFRDLSINDNFEEKYIIYEEGEWDKYYETGTKASLRLTPAFVREVDNNIDLTIVNYNANREGRNALGMALPFWRVNVFEYGEIYDNVDDEYDVLDELHKLTNKRGHVYSAINTWKRGYDIRHGNSEKLDEYVAMAELIRATSIKLEPEVIQEVNARFGTKYTAINQIRDQDFGFDSGFSYINYTDKGKKEESRALQDLATGDTVLPERAITFIPGIQTVTIKDFIGNKFIRKVNDNLPKEWQLEYYSRLD